MRIVEAALILMLFPSMVIGVGALLDRAIKYQDIVCQEGC